MKQSLVLIAPVDTLSGYGKRSADIARALISLDKYDIKILSLRWGNTPMNALDRVKDKQILDRIIKRPNEITRQPDITIQVTIPEEFNMHSIKGKYNIGITAGIETDTPPDSWYDGCERMDLVLFSSNFSRNGFIKKSDNKRVLTKVKTDVLFEGIDTNIFGQPAGSSEMTSKLNSIDSDFNFIFVGHWLPGDFGHDRKNVGKMIQIFLETFKNMDNAPGLILKTNIATSSYIDYETVRYRIEEVSKTVIATKLPSVHLLCGEPSDIEMNDIYMHPKVSAMLYLGKGEGFGRPLLEFSMTGKPIIASKWSGHLDFLDRECTALVNGKIEQIHPSASNRFLIPESKWFEVDINDSISKLIDVYSRYNQWCTKSKKMKIYNKQQFTLEKMTKKLSYILDTYVPDFPQFEEIIIPNDIESSNESVL